MGDDPLTWTPPRTLRLVLLASAVAGCVSRPANEPSVPAAASSAVDHDSGRDLTFERVAGYVESIGEGWNQPSKFTGFVLVARHDRVLYAHAFGFADYGRSRPATADTSFRVGSVTKQFTAAAILRLEQAGKLSVDDPVKMHLPDYPGPGRDVTIHQLLTHTGGLPNYYRIEDSHRAKSWSVRELMETFWNEPLEFAPGTTQKYSNSDYIVLGAIIERLSGQSYAEFLRKELFLPAGMSRTMVGDAEGDADRAVGYQAADDKLVPARPVDLSYPFAAGAVSSTANDLVRWHCALQNDAILNERSRRELYTPERDHYAYGWVIDRPFGRRTVRHDGGIDGFHADYWRDLDDDVVVVVLGNTFENDTAFIARMVLGLAIGEPMPPAPPRRIDWDPSLLPRLTGTYRMTPENERDLASQNVPPKIIADLQTITITGTATGIVMKPNGQRSVRLAPIDRGVFFDPVARIKVTFELGAGTDPVPQVISESGPVRLTYSRSP